MHRTPHKPGARINPILAIAVALVALVAVLLLLNPPRVVDSPTSSPTPSPTEETTDSTSQSETSDSTEESQEANNETNEETSQSTDATEASGPATATCAEDADVNHDGTWRAEMNSETRALLEEIIASHGGLETLNSICTLHGTGSSQVSAQGQTINSEVELWLRLPNQVRNLVKVSLPIPGQFIETLIVWQGSRGWTKTLNPENMQVEINELSSDLKVQAVEEIALHPVLALKAVQDSDATFNYLGTEEPQNEGTHAIQFRTALGSTGVFFYDTSNYQTLSLYREGGGRSVDKSYASYQSVDGISMPHTINTTLNDPEIGEYTTELTYESILVNEALELSLFDQPTADQ